MIKHNIKIAWRNLLKFRLQTSISILSLTVGMVCFALSALWLRYENSYDTWWPEHEDVYMLEYSDGSYDMERGYTPWTPYSSGDRLRENIPEIELLSRMVIGGCYLKLSPDSNEAVGCSFLMVDENVQEMMGIKVVDGKKQLSFSPDEIALTRSTADRLFPGKNAIGQKVWIDNYSYSRYLNVVSIIEDTDEPTSFPYSFMKAFDELYKHPACRATSTFIKVRPENVDKVAKMLEKDVEVHKSDEWSYVQEHHYKMLPLDEVRKDTHLTQAVVEQNHLKLFVILGAIVICCALFNYFTMLITRIRIRQRELALRYVSGATMWSLIGLLSTELIIILLVSTLMATGAVIFTLDDFKAICDIQQPVSFFVGWFLVYALLVSVVSLLIATGIVSYYNHKHLKRTLYKHKAPVVRSRFVSSHSMLLSFQLAVSIAAVFCSFAMMNQINYLCTSPDMGFAKHNRGFIEMHRNNDDKRMGEFVARLTQELKQWPELKTFLVGYQYPIPSGFQHTIDILTEEGEEKKVIEVEADEDYFRFMEMQLIEGEFLGNEDNSSAVCINETAARMLGEQGKVGGKFAIARNYDPDFRFVVKGIVKDLSYMSPTTPSQPMIFELRPQKDFSYAWIVTFPIQVMEGTDAEKFKEKVRNLSQVLFGDGTGSISLFMAEEEYERYLQSERTLVRLLMVVTAVCVLIAVFGIFSMVSLACERRRKEIAIRKVHGAKTGTIMRMFLRGYMQMLLVAAIVAFPTGYYLMHKWIMQYAKQAPIYWWVYPSILLSMALLIIATIYWQIRKAARENPADVIKNE